MAFKPTTTKPDFVELEKKLLDWWDKKGIVKKYLHRNDPPSGLSADEAGKAKKRFRFLDGPITANNPMGVHHAWGRTYKDLFQRYKNMQGYQQRFQNGFDNQGLWVEVEVEKELGFKDKKDIEKYGIAKFVNKCKERTLRFARIMTEQSKRLAYFMDWGHSYYTMSDENNYMIWSFLKKCWQDGNLYKGRDSVPWCPRCGTAISQHEILTEDYKELTHQAIAVEYPLKGAKDEFLLVWTTTPWTLPANVAIAVNPELDYVKFTTKMGIFYATESYMKRTAPNAKKVKKIKGKELVGRKYQGLFDHLPAVKKAFAQKPQYEHQIIPWKEVLEEEGTGLVHIAPGGGEEDFDLGKEFDLPVVGPLDQAGVYLEGFGDFSGRPANKVSQLVIEFLKKEDRNWLVENFTHRYPICWRCKTELLWRVVDEWYLAMDDTNKKAAKNYRQRMITIAKKIHWIPGFGLKRELDWLRNMDDWLISKKRYWGLALPIWECQKCGHFELIGSKEELKKRAAKGWSKFKGHSPHRPWVDQIKIKCSQCGEEVSRIPDVGNPWLDAGIVSFSTLVEPKTNKVSYSGDKKYWHEWFPADFVTECFPGQFKNWFYSLIAMSTVLEDKEPFKILLGYASVRDEKGEEMHKSKGNAIEFNEAAEKMGVDVMRWMYLSQNPRLNLNFGFRAGDEVRRRFHLLLWNIYNFFVTYANLDHWKPRIEFKKKPTNLDLWILTRLDETMIVVTGSLDDYDPQTATLAIEDFVQDLSTWYVRRSRDRVGPTAKNKEDKDLTYSTLYTVLVVLSQALAPFTPFLAEEIYQNLTGEESVHLSDWPEVKTRKVLDQKLLNQMALVRDICELGHAARKKEGIKVRQPLRKARCKIEKGKLDKALAQLVKEELNVKEVELLKGEETEVKLDTKMTPELQAEGEARELVRQIQSLRKEAGFRLDQSIVVSLPKIPQSGSLIDYLKRKTLAKKIISGKKLKISSS